MASKTKVTLQKEEAPEKEGADTSPDHPLLDLSDAAVTKLIGAAKKRGYVTHDQINSVLRSETVNSEQMEDLLAMFSDTGINVIETAEAEADEGEREEAHEEPGSEGGELVEMAHRIVAAHIDDCPRSTSHGAWREAPCRVRWHPKTNFCLTNTSCRGAGKRHSSTKLLLGASATRGLGPSTGSFQ
jgi:hypothetical protein